MLDADGKLLITDFGLARIGTDTTMTMTGDLVGTLRYMSPEQALGNRGVVDHRSDIYSLGITLYELATLRPAFDGNDRQQLLQQIAQENPKSPRQIDPNIPRDLETIILKSIDKQPDGRFVTAEELADDLQRFIDQQPIVARRASLFERTHRWSRRHAAVFWSIMAVFTMAVASLALAWRHEVRQRENAVEHANALQGQIYSSTIALAQEAIEEHRSLEAKELLDSCPQELRSWEWQYLLHNADRSVRRAKVKHHHGPTHDPVFSPDGSRIALVGGGHLTLFESASLKSLWEVAEGAGYSARPINVEFLKDSRQLCVGYFRTGELAVLDAASGGLIRKLQGEARGNVDAIQILPKQHQAICLIDHELSLWDLAEGRALWTQDLAKKGLELSSFKLHSNGREMLLEELWKKRVHTYDITSGEMLTTFLDKSLKPLHGEVSHAEHVTSAAYGVDKKYAFTVAGDGILKKWNVKTGELLISRQAHDDYAYSVVPSPDGHWIATVGTDRTLRIWHSDNLEQFTTLHGHQGHTQGIAWSPRGDRIATAANLTDSYSPGIGEAEILLWSAAVGPNPRILKRHRSWHRRWPREEATSSITFLNGGKWMATSHLDIVYGDTVCLWEFESGQEIHNLRGTCDRSQNINVVASTKHGTIVGGGVDGRVYVWTQIGNLESPSEFNEQIIPGEHQVEIEGVDVRDDGSLLAWVDRGGTLSICNPKEGSPVIARQSNDAPLRAVVFHPTQPMVATAGDDQIIRLHNSESATLISELRGHTESVRALAFSPDGSLLASGSSDTTVRVWDVAARKLVTILRGHAGMVRSVDFHPTHSRVASASSDGTVRIWSPTSEYALLTLRPRTDIGLLGRQVFCVRFHPGGDALLAGMEDGTIRVWETTEDQTINVRRQHVILARREVDRLRQEHGFYKNVLEVLGRTESEFDPVVRSRAHEIATARLEHDQRAGQELMGFKMWVDLTWEQSPGRTAECLEITRKAVELQPDGVIPRIYLALAQYRSRDYEAALMSLDHAVELRRTATGDMRAHAGTFLRPLILYQLERRDEAQLALEAARALATSPRFAVQDMDSNELTLYYEAEKMLGE